MDFTSQPSVNFAGFLLISSICYGLSSSSCQSGDLKALRDFAGNLTNGSIIFSSAAAGEEACCLWTGVFCSNYSRVIRLLLPDRGLHGSISSSLTNLDQLRSLDLSGNLLAGGIPPELSNIRRLEHLDLSHNALSGPVTAVAAMTSLRSLNLSSNFFNGSLADLGADLTNLVYLNISNNSFYGPFGQNICIGSSLIQVIDLSMNSFDGELAGESFANCWSSLKELDLGSNYLKVHCRLKFILW